MSIYITWSAPFGVQESLLELEWCNTASFSKEYRRRLVFKENNIFSNWVSWFPRIRIFLKYKKSENTHPKHLKISKSISTTLNSCFVPNRDTAPLRSKLVFQIAKYSLTQLFKCGNQNWSKTNVAFAPKTRIEIIVFFKDKIRIRSCLVNFS